MKVGRVAIITRGRYAGKKVRQKFPPEKPSGQDWLRLDERVETARLKKKKKKKAMLELENGK